MSARRLGRAGLIALLALALPVLDGCGKKPGRLDPPEGAGPEAALFPHRYPNPKYDPVPTGPGNAAPGGATGAAPAGTVAPAPLEPLRPTQAYPKIFRPDDMLPTTTIPIPGSSSRSSYP